MMQHLDLSERAAVVTGGSYGLGRATALALARAGADIAVLARGQEKLEKTAELIRNEGVRALHVVTDLRDARAIKRAAEMVANWSPKMHFLINNASAWYQGSFAEPGDEELSAIVEATVTGTMLLTREILPLLRNAECASIVNIASTAALAKPDPASSSIPFIAAKYGIVGFSESLRQELREDRIRVTTLYPGAFDTKGALDCQSPDTWGAGMMHVADVVDAILFAISASRRTMVESIVITAT